MSPLSQRVGAKIKGGSFKKGSLPAKRGNMGLRHLREGTLHSQIWRVLSRGRNKGKLLWQNLNSKMHSSEDLEQGGQR